MARERTETTEYEPPKADIYLALLIVTTLATAVASLLMYFEMQTIK
jgi:hypothetical protein